MIHERNIRRTLAGLAVALGTLALVHPASAACLSPQQTRAAVAAGEAVRLATALRRAGIDGEAVNAVLCGSPGAYVYQVQVLGPDGSLRQVNVPAS